MIVNYLIEVESLSRTLGLCYGEDGRRIQAHLTEKRQTSERSPIDETDSTNQPRFHHGDLP
ncbi:hypothetical protein KIN20_013575 [Parelaphostrongylus tenuis]|uniref:Uncharacterized protein n=1 Tax=Parelaphostrongylus tenuis TaxID=148309 RepID=A0AAD5QNN0_PARTN|nr:hypothetical protein KIN20_013575 [Parelaphostrongylus tenuis]